MSQVGTSSAATGKLEWEVEDPDSSAVVPHIRHGIEGALRNAGVEAPIFLAAVSEVVTNAYRYSHHYFVVIFIINEVRAELTVFDDNLEDNVVIPAPNSQAQIIDGDEPEGGFGLYVLAAAAHTYSVSHGLSRNGHPVKSVQASIELSHAA